MLRLSYGIASWYSGIFPKKMANIVYYIEYYQSGVLH